MFTGPASDVGPRTEPQLAEDPSDVVACRALGDRELRGDLAVGKALGDEGRDLLLSAGELAHRFAGRYLLRHGGRGPIDLRLGEGVLGGLFERHRPTLGQGFVPRYLSQPGTGCGQVGLVQRPLAGWQSNASDLAGRLRGSPQVCRSSVILQR